MHEAIASMMDKYECQSSSDYTNALREILQEVVLLGLWRSKFFDKAAFYGGTALRILYGLDRYSEDMDFSLLSSMEDFDLGNYGKSLERELLAFGFEVSVQKKEKVNPGSIQSAFLKADTYRELLLITTDEEIVRQIPKGSILKIRLEVDSNPPSGFSTETKYLLQPIPFSIRSFTLPSLFAGKMHAVLCRQWKTRVKGRDWYDLVWYVGKKVPFDLGHLQKRMHQSGHLAEDCPLTESLFQELLAAKIDVLDLDKARLDVDPFVKDDRAMDVWSDKFFHDVRSRIKVI